MKPGDWWGVTLAISDFSYALMLKKQPSKLPGSTAGGDLWRLVDRYRQQAGSYRGLVSYWGKRLV
jgi:hypothetical protein